MTRVPVIVLLVLETVFAYVRQHSRLDIIFVNVARLAKKKLHMPTWIIDGFTIGTKKTVVDPLLSSYSRTCFQGGYDAEIRGASRKNGLVHMRRSLVSFFVAVNNIRECKQLICRKVCAIFDA